MLKYLKDFKQPLTKQYKAGMYGGKFMPMHKGHLYCLKQAVKLCDKVYLVLFSGGAWERLERGLNDRELYTVESRWAKLREVAKRFDNVIPIHIDVSHCIKPDGSEDWDAETPLVLNALGVFDAVFGSEPIMYGPYFDRAYPWADYVVVDPERIHVPISATVIRHEMDDEEAKSWLA